MTALLGLEPAPPPAYASFIGAFVLAVGLAYLYPFLLAAAARAVRFRVVFEITAISRLAVASYPGRGDRDRRARAVVGRGPGDRSRFGWLSGGLARGAPGRRRHEQCSAWRTRRRWRRSPPPTPTSFSSISSPCSTCCRRRRVRPRPRRRWRRWAVAGLAASLAARLAAGRGPAAPAALARRCLMAGFAGGGAAALLAPAARRPRPAAGRGPGGPRHRADHRAAGGHVARAAGRPGRPRFLLRLAGRPGHRPGLPLLQPAAGFRRQPGHPLASRRRGWRSAASWPPGGCGRSRPLAGPAGAALGQRDLRWWGLASLLLSFLALVWLDSGGLRGDPGKHRAEGADLGAAAAPPCCWAACICWPRSPPAG